MNTSKKYLAIFYLNLKKVLVYRGNVLIKFITQIVNLAVTLWMWQQLLKVATQISLFL